MTQALTFKHLLATFSPDRPLVIEFASHGINKFGILDLEGIAQPGMRGNLTGMALTNQGETLRLTVDYAPFAQHNRSFQDGDGTESLCVDPKNLVGDFFQVLDAPVLTLVEAWKAQGAGKSYVQWLEEKVLTTPSVSDDLALPNREALVDVIAENLGSVYVCSRTWSAWGVGTMSQNDFHDASDSDVPSDIADQVLSLLEKQRRLFQAAQLAASMTPPPADREKPRPRV